MKRAFSSVVPVRRSLARFAGLVSAVLALVLTAPAVAMADTPEGWAENPEVSGLDFLLVLLLIPFGLAVVIVVLTSIPSWNKDSGHEPGQPWTAEPAWFGGAKGVDGAAAPALEAGEGGESTEGGARGSW